MTSEAQRITQSENAHFSGLPQVRKSELFSGQEKANFGQGILRKSPKVRKNTKYSFKIHWYL